MKTCEYVMNSVMLNVRRCWVDILGTNCNKLLKLTGGRGGGGLSFSMRNHAQQGAVLVQKMLFCVFVVI